MVAFGFYNKQIVDSSEKHKNTCYQQIRIGFFAPILINFVVELRHKTNGVLFRSEQLLVILTRFQEALCSTFIFLYNKHQPAIFVYMVCDQYVLLIEMQVCLAVGIFLIQQKTRSISFWVRQMAISYQKSVLSDHCRGPHGDTPLVDLSCHHKKQRQCFNGIIHSTSLQFVTI